MLRHLLMVQLGWSDQAATDAELKAARDLYAANAALVAISSG